MATKNCSNGDLNELKSYFYFFFTKISLKNRKSYKLCL